MVIVEAEAAQEMLSGSDDDWVAGNDRPDAAGNGFVVARPDDGDVIAEDGLSESAQLRIEVAFAQAGTYSVWVRGWAPAGNGDSIYVGLDDDPSSAQAVSGFAIGTWGWTRVARDGDAVEVVIDQAGVHVINVWMREDGIAIDRLLLTTSSIYNPTGKGPRASSRVKAIGTPIERRSTTSPASPMPGDGTGNLQRLTVIE